MDEGLAMMRDVWAKDPVDLHGKYITAEGKGLTMLPQPVKPIPLWLCGTADAAIERTIRLAAGWHGSAQTPEQTAPIVHRLRAARPNGFTISMRIGWNGKDAGVLRERIAAYAAVGVQHIMVAPEDREVDDWDEVIEGAGRMV